MQDNTLTDLLQKLKDGDPTALEALYHQLSIPLYTVMIRITGDAHLAEEITQEAFYKAMEHLDRFDGKCKLYVWLCQIAKNTYYSYSKKQKRITSEEEPPPQPEISIEHRLLEKETAWQLHRLLHQLNEPYKEVFSLRVFGELSFSQIGELFGKTDSWARLVFYRAKTELRRNLDEDTLQNHR